MDYFVALYRKSKRLKFDELETSINLPPQQSLDKLRKKGSKIISTEKWNSISKDAHDKAFTVANVMSADIVQEIYDYVQRAIEDGWSFDKFKKQVSDGDLLDRMTKAGWTGGENPQRLKIIFDTNIKMAVGKGKYERLKATSDIRPYWIYHQVDRKNKRHAHSKWNGRKFRHDDPIWDYIYPPSDFGCACWVEATADPTGVENGSLFIDELKNNSDYKLCPTKQWQPDTSKYVDGLRKALDKMLKDGKIDKNGGKPDCDWFGVTYAESNIKKNCIGKVPGQKTWKDYDRPDLSTLDDEYKLDEPERIKQENSENAALDSLLNALGFKGKQSITINSPIEEIILTPKALRHIVEKRDNARERFANYIIPTLENPFEIYQTEYEDNTNRNAYIGVFKGKTNLLCIVRINADGSLLWNAIPMKSINSSRVGNLLYAVEIK